MKICFVLIAAVLLFASCKTGGGAFGKKSYHEQYGKKLIDAGLEDASLGRLWFSAATEALNQPAAVKLPFRQVGYFSSERPGAIGLSFEAKRGQKLLFELKKNPVSGFIIYSEIWKIDGGERKLEFSADTIGAEFSYEVDETGSYLFRMQPELLQSGEYTLSISVGPSLTFPVAGNARIGSFWGAPRDGGARSHEGIDIFAPKRTPVLATSDGIVSRVTENNIGGKVLFLRPAGKDFSVYYAHLDEQLASSGQRVKAGDTLGLVGNTGNARTTPPHLHLGIYASGGAIDPLVFVNPVVKKAPSLPVAAGDMKGAYRLTKDVRTASGRLLSKNSIVHPFAQSNEFVWAYDGAVKEKIERNVLRPAVTELKSMAVKDTLFVFERPEISSPRKGHIKSGKVSVLGMEGRFGYIKSAELEGWVLNSSN